VDVIDACLQRIDEVNPLINAVVQRADERARYEAMEMDALAARGTLKGPLHGVPITLKDSLDTEGLISSGGTQGRADYVPDQDAPVVAALRAAGAVVLGKTNTPELTLGGETDNLVYGRTNNPYDLECSPGGSSGGSASIIAARGVGARAGLGHWWQHSRACAPVRCCRHQADCGSSAADRPYYSLWRRGA
jgi:amidase